MVTGNVMNAVDGEETMTQKRIELFKQLVPSLTRALKQKDALQKVAARLDFELIHYGLNTLTFETTQDDCWVTELPDVRNGSGTGKRSITF